MKNIAEISWLFENIGKEIWENGELSSQSKSILISGSISQLRNYKEQGRQMLIAQVRANKNHLPEWQEAFELGLDFTLIIFDEYFVKDLLDILCDNKGNYIIKKLLLRTSQQIDKFVEVEDTTELDEATYQQLKGNIEKVVRLANSGLLPEPGPAQIENWKQILRQTSPEEIGAVFEVMRKFALKVLEDPELDVYLQQIPAAWRPELKTLGKSFINLAFATFNRDLFYDFIPVLLDAEWYAADQKVSNQELEARTLSIITKHLKKWIAQKKLYIKKSLAYQSQPDTLNLVQQSFNQLTFDRSQQKIQQLQTEISQLQTRIQKLESGEAKSYNVKNEIVEESQKLNQKQKKLADIQRFAEKENNSSSSKTPQIIQTNLNLDELAERLGQFDHKQQENKWSGGKIALVVASCILGGGLIAFLLWLVFRKKKL